MEDQNPAFPDKIGVRIKCLSNLLERRMANDADVRQTEGATGMHGWLIGYIEKQDTVYQRDLERRFNMRRSTVTKMLQLMEKNGLVVRESAEGDGRLKKIVLTDRAREVSNMLKQKIRDTETLMKDGIDEQDLRVFCLVADKIAENLVGISKEEGKCLR